VSGSAAEQKAAYFAKNGGFLPFLRGSRKAVAAGLSLALAACGQPRPVIIAPPAELTSCAAEPQAPDLPAVDWSSVETARPVQRARDIAMLQYVLAWRTAHGDCAAKIAGVKAWREGVE